MAEPGHWEGPENFSALYGVRPEIARSTAAAVLEDLARAGLLVTTRYYVPSPGELYDLYGAISHELHRGLKGVRWVMCRETHDAIWRRERNRVAALPRAVQAWFAETPPWSAVDTVNVVDVDYRAQTARLFGIPVRIDPAARSPLIEIDTEATLRR